MTTSTTPGRCSPPSARRTEAGRHPCASPRPASTPASPTSSSTTPARPRRRGRSTTTSTSSRPACVRRRGRGVAPVDVSDPADSSNDLRLAGGPAGTATAVWEANVGGALTRCRSSSPRCCRGARGPPGHHLRRARLRYQPTIAVNAAGQAIAGWDDESNDLGGRRSPAAPPTAPGSRDPARRHRPRTGAVVAIDSSGVATAVWRDNEGTDPSRFAPGSRGAWSEPVQVPGSESPCDDLSSPPRPTPTATSWSPGRPWAVPRACKSSGRGPRRGGSPPERLRGTASAGVGKGLNFSARRPTTGRRWRPTPGPSATARPRPARGSPTPTPPRAPTP